jgi:hypothetical protein
MKFLENKQLNNITFHCIFILSVYAILFFIRLPILVNAEVFLNIDEAFMANDMANLFEGDQFHFYHENVSYHGIFHSLIAIPFFWLFGVSSFAFKLPSILYYTLYIWTFFLLTMRINRKIAWISVALLVLCPPGILNITVYNFPHTLVAGLGNVAFLIYLSHRDNPTHRKIFYITFIMGFSLYVYILSAIYSAVIIFLWIMDSKTFVRNVFEQLKPVCLRQGFARLIDIIIFINISWILLTYLTGGISSKIGDLGLFNSFMRTSAPHYRMLGSSNVHIPLIEFFILMVILRVVIYRTDIIRFIKMAKNSPSFICLGVGLLGFLMGLTPRWIGLYRNRINGHPGYELDFGLPQMWHKLSDLVSVKFPQILELNSYFGVLVALLVGLAIFNSLRRDKAPVKIIFAILPIIVVLAITMYQKPNVPRHIFPIYGVIVFYAASFLSNVEKKSIYSFWILLVFWGSFYSYATYNQYNKQNIVDGFSILEKETPFHSLIRYARDKQFEVVYTDYSAHKLQFLSGGNPSFVEFYRNPIRGWERIKQTANLPNFAVFISENSKNVSVYENFIKATKITCDREKVSKYLIFSKCRGPSKIFSSGALRYLRILAQREHAT